MPVSPDIPAAEIAIVEMTNDLRGRHSLGALKPSPPLAAAARAYAKALARRGELSHTADGTTPTQRAARAGYAACEIAENLALIYDSRGFTAAEYAGRAVAGWEASPGHRRNMLRPHVTETGVAVERASPSDPRYVAVQLLGRPQALTVEFRVANRAQRPVSYTFAGETHVVAPRETVTHRSCAPGPIAFATGAAGARYEVRGGETYTLRPAVDGGVRVEVGARPE